MELFEGVSMNDDFNGSLRTLGDAVHGLAEAVAEELLPRLESLAGALNAPQDSGSLEP